MSHDHLLDIFQYHGCRLMSNRYWKYQATTSKGNYKTANKYIFITNTCIQKPNLSLHYACCGQPVGYNVPVNIMKSRCKLDIYNKLYLISHIMDI